MLIASLALPSRIVSSAFYEVTETEAQGGIKKGCEVKDGRARGEVLGRSGEEEEPKFTPTH